jgi:hypothetical protein
MAAFAKGQTMRRALDLLDRIPLWQAVLFAALLGLSPFVPEPHLVEKLRMLAQGRLVRAVDLFDLFFHAVPLALGVLKLARVATVGRR